MNEKRVTELPYFYQQWILSCYCFIFRIGVAGTISNKESPSLLFTTKLTALKRHNNAKTTESEGLS